MGASLTYQYDALSPAAAQIRLMRLLPASDKDDPLRCTLSVVSLTSAHAEYEALSYVWGTPTAAGPPQLHIDDQALAISPNLSTALRYLRLRTESRILWVDAVCINQGDEEEKSMQVRQMRNIYESAARVVVWLGESGPGDEELDEAMAFLNLGEEEREAHPAKPLLGFANMLARPWWSRIWVVQEVTVAKQHPLVMCGHKTASWEAVRASITKIAACHLSEEDNTWGIRDRFVKNPSDLLWFGFLRSKGGEARSNLDLPTLLRATRNRYATDPRDHVYALLGLVVEPPSSATHAKLEVDYMTTPAEVNQLATMYLIAHNDKPAQKLDWLMDSFTTAPVIVDKPTWCIDFASPLWGRAPIEQGWVYVTTNASEGCGLDWASSTSPSSPLLPHPTHDLSLGTLTVLGTPVGTIRHVHPVPSSYRAAKQARKSGTADETAVHDSIISGIAELGNCIDTFTPFALTSLLSWKPLSSVGVLLGSGLLWRVVAGGIPPRILYYLAGLYPQPNADLSAADGIYGMLEAYAQGASGWRHKMAQSFGWANHTPKIEGEFGPAAVSLLGEVAYCSGGKTLFTTDSGFVGVAGSNAVVLDGDVVAVLWGCRLPAVLRLKGEGGYSLVTFAYVDGIMEGEIFKSSETGQVKTEEFVLR